MNNAEIQDHLCKIYSLLNIINYKSTREKASKTVAVYIELEDGKGASCA